MMMKRKLFSTLVLLVMAATGVVAQNYKVSVKEGTEDATNWSINPAEATTTGVAQGTQVTASYGGTKKVKSVKAVKKAAAVPSYDNTLNINTYDPELNNWEDVTVPTGKHWLITGTGEATTNTIIIENNATVTLSGVNITAFGRSITCVGNATIILADGTTNNLYAADDFGAAGIEMSGGSGTSLTIQGNTGVLNITSGSGPAIGAGYGHAGCAINIEGGIINATSTDGPGIGAAYSTACGNITISGGTVAATGGYGCPGIGGASSANCGDITITSGVTSVTATKGSEAPYSIGASSSGSCGTITIGGVVGAITESPFTYPAPAGNPAPTTASIEDYTAGTFGWNGDGSAATNLPTINTFAANDRISILSAKNTNTQFTTSAGGASATFSGTATDDSKFYAVYPYTDGLTLSGDVISGIVIPSIQWNGKWYEDNNSAWDPNAPVAYATTTGSSLQFHNLCAILKIKVVGSSDYGYAGKITISADQALAGTFSLDTSTGTLTATEGSTTVDTGDTWDAGHWVYFENNYCYFAIAPGTYSNFKVHTDIWGDPKEDKTKASVTFEKGKIYDLGEFSCN